MTIADWCLPAAVLLYILTIALAKAQGRRAFDNGNPRDPAFYRDPLRARLLGAHNNGIEAFPFFAAAILLAEFKGGAQPAVDALAVGFLLVRAAYVGAYAADRPTARSLLWSAGFAVNLLIFASPALWPS